MRILSYVFSHSRQLSLRSLLGLMALLSTCVCATPVKALAQSQTILSRDERSDCLCAHNAHLCIACRVCPSTGWKYAIWFILFVVHNFQQISLRKARSFTLCRERESCVSHGSRITDSGSWLAMQMHLSLWPPVRCLPGFQFVFGSLSLSLSGVDSLIWLSYLRSVSIKCGRRIVKHDVRYRQYVGELYSLARGWDCFNNFDVITSQQSVLSLCLESFKWTIFFWFLFLISFLGSSFYSFTNCPASICDLCSFKWITIFYL